LCSKELGSDLESCILLPFAKFQGLTLWSLQRMIVGNKVIDHERVYGMAEQPYEVMVVYEVQDGLIVNAWFYPVG